MHLFLKLFGPWIQFIYHTFDRVVINGYLDFFRAEAHVVEFFHQVVKEPIITKAVLRRRTPDYYFYIYDPILGAILGRLTFNARNFVKKCCNFQAANASMTP